MTENVQAEHHKQAVQHNDHIETLLRGLRILQPSDKNDKPLLEQLEHTSHHFGCSFKRHHTEPWTKKAAHEKDQKNNDHKYKWHHTDSSTRKKDRGKNGSAEFCIQMQGMWDLMSKNSV